MKAFSDAFPPATMLVERVNVFVKEVDAAVLLVGPSGAVLQTHSWTRFGGTRSCPSFIVGSLIEMGPRAGAVIINHSAAVASLTVTIPAATKIANCKTVGELVALARMGGTMAPMATTAPTMTTMSPMVPQATTPAARIRPADEEH